jgi:hypothetical protein
VKTCPKAFQLLSAALALSLSMALLPCLLPAQNPSALSGPPPAGGGFFPLSQVRRGMTATAWTVFTGSKPEPMDVEILGVLRGARGPHHDMILVQLHGTKPEYTGVVAGMSGSPVYIGNKLLGALAFRIGQFSKDPIAGVTPIEQMLEVLDAGGPQAPPRNQDALSSSNSAASTGSGVSSDGMNFRAMETPLIMSGFQPEAIRLWQQKMTGTGLETVAAGGMGSSSAPSIEPSTATLEAVLPGSAVSAQLVRGDLEIAATCTVTYVDAKRLLACGHPLLQAGPVSLPMTASEVVATLASPLNAFKIVNTGPTIGAFTEDRDAAISGVLGAKARMIPMHIVVHGQMGERQVNVEVLDLPSLTPQAMLVTLYSALLQTNESSAETSYHLTGSIKIEGYPPSPLDIWGSAGGMMPSQLTIALLAGERFSRIYSNGSREGAVRGIDLDIAAIPHRVQVELETVRLVSDQTIHAGDTVIVEATVRPWQQQARNIRIPVTIPSRLVTGSLRLLISDAATLDHTLEQPRRINRPTDLETVLAQARCEHRPDSIYASLLLPETQAEMNGQTLSSLPLSMANALEPLRSTLDANLNGESAEVAGEAPVGGVLNGFQILTLRIEPGGGLN